VQLGNQALSLQASVPLLGGLFRINVVVDQKPTSLFFSVEVN
jgi:hypothetical protein